MSWLEALVLGIIQGLTEYLPISSSGHLEIFQWLLGTQGGDNLFFTTVVHCATVCSTLTIFRKDILDILRGVFTSHWNAQKEYSLKIVLSMLPILVVGLFFKDTVESFFGSGLRLIGVGLLCTSVLLCVSEYVSIRRDASRSLSYTMAFVVGCAQVLAVWPGLSRSGTTISTGLLCGMKREEVAKFSFLMVVIPILGETFLDVLKIFSGATVVSLGAMPLLCGFAAAYIVGCVTCRWMIKLVNGHKLTYFGIYCLLVGLSILLFA